MALRRGLTATMRARWTATTSETETWRLRMSWANVVAEAKIRSSMRYVLLVRQVMDCRIAHAEDGLLAAADPGVFAASGRGLQEPAPPAAGRRIAGDDRCGVG